MDPNCSGTEGHPSSPSFSQEPLLYDDSLDLREDLRQGWLLYGLVLLHAPKWMAVPPIEVINAENPLCLLDKRKIDSWVLGPWKTSMNVFV